MGHELVGKSYTFDDGNSITIIQVKDRDDDCLVTYLVKQGPGIPRKLVMSLTEFENTYGHLFSSK